MHSVEAIITTENFAQELAGTFVSLRRVTLTQGYIMIPLTEALKDDIEELIGMPSMAYDCFHKLSDSIVQMIKDARCADKVAYVETEFFGGVGEQAAIVWENGDIIYGPEFADNCSQPINRALKILGVRIIKSPDEFEEINLHWIRSTEKWYELGK